jgi:Tfp pilus assembly protein PilN
MEFWILLTMAFVWQAYAFYVIWRAERSGSYTKTQLALQLCIATMIPLLGAFAIHLLLLTEGKTESSDKNHALQEDQIGMNPSQRSSSLED